MLCRLLALRLLCEVRELVGSEDELLALGSIGMTLVVRCVDSILDIACEHLSEEATGVFCVEEELPSLLSYSVCEVLYRV